MRPHISNHTFCRLSMFAAWGAAYGSIPDAMAQNDRYGGFISRIDQYGNADVGFDDRRVLDVYQNQAQRNALQRYQEFGRRPENRGEFLPYTFPNDDLRGTRPPSWLYQRPTTALTPADQRTLTRFGGFGERPPLRYGGDIQSIFSRRNELLRATTQTAPVRRAMLQYNALTPLPDRLRSTPFFPGSRVDAKPSGPWSEASGDNTSWPAPEVTSEAGEGGRQEVSLAERLQSQAQAFKEAALREGWTWFQAGEFRRAARRFDAAAALDRADLEPQLGRFFSYAALGSYASALTQLRFIAQRVPQPFVHDFSIRNKFTAESIALDFALQVRLQTQAGGDTPLLVVLNGVTLWYLGEREGARRELNGVEKALSGTIFRDWPARLREAMERPVTSAPGVGGER